MTELLSRAARRDHSWAAEALRTNLGRLLQPRSIAIAGATSDSRTMGGTILANCERFRFDETLYLISPIDWLLGIAIGRRAVRPAPIVRHVGRWAHKLNGAVAALVEDDYSPRASA